MNKRQAKKARRKVVPPFADEMNLLTLSDEEYKEAMKEFDDFIWKNCRYFHYKDKYKKPMLRYIFPAGQKYREFIEHMIKTSRKYSVNTQLEK